MSGWIRSAEMRAIEMGIYRPRYSTFAIVSLKALDLSYHFRYGLTVELLNASGVLSLLRSTKYLCRKSTGRAKSASMLLEAFVVALFIFVLSHTIK